MTLTRYRHKPQFRLFRRFTQWRALLAGIALVGVWVAPAAGAAECALRVGWDEWPPYITYQDGDFRGMEYELLKATAGAAGCKLDMRRVPWARALLMLSEGKLDLLYGAGYTAERARYARFSVPYRMEQFVLVTKAGTEGVDSSVSLERWIQSRPGGDKRTLGLFRGNSYGEGIDQILERNADGVEVIRLNSNEQMAYMVGLERLDGFIVEEGVVRMLEQESASPLRWRRIEEQVADPLHYMFSLHISDDIVQRFNKAIQKKRQ